ncbi:dynactin 4 [Aphelenchoides avenae]|nr:dynactin 4 [Aphelenchus avenae]
MAARCSLCTNEEIDILYCPNCLENIPPSDARQRKNCCKDCNQCPLCGSFLVSRGTNDLYHLQCNTCKWTSQDASIPDQKGGSAAAWPEHANPLEEKLNDVVAQMKKLDEYDKLIEPRTYTKKRVSNLGTLSNDKYGLQNMYNLRRKTLFAERPASTEHSFAPTTEVPELDEKIFTESVDVGKIPTLDQIIRQPLCGNGPLYPLKLRITARRMIRCAESDQQLYRGEYSPSIVKARFQAPACDYLPDVRISRDIQLTPDQWSSIFLTISNFTQSPMEVVFQGEYNSAEADCLECSDASTEITIPPKDDAKDIDDSLEPASVPEDGETKNVVFRRRHRVGVHVECKAAKEQKDCYALLSVKYRSTAGETALNRPPEEGKWFTQRVKVFIPRTEDEA